MDKVYLCFAVDQKGAKHVVSIYATKEDAEKCVNQYFNLITSEQINYYINAYYLPITVDQKILLT